MSVDELEDLKDDVDEFSKRELSIMKAKALLNKLHELKISPWYLFGKSYYPSIAVDSYRTIFRKMEDAIVDLKSIILHKSTVIDEISEEALKQHKHMSDTLHARDTLIENLQKDKLNIKNELQAAINQNRTLQEKYDAIPASEDKDALVDLVNRHTRDMEILGRTHTEEVTRLKGVISDLEKQLKYLKAGKKVFRSKILTCKQVKRIRALPVPYDTSEVCENFGISKNTLYKIRKFITYKDCK